MFGNQDEEAIERQKRRSGFRGTVMLFALSIAATVALWHGVKWAQPYLKRGFRATASLLRRLNDM